MSNFAGASRTVVIRTSRETLGLAAAASVMTFAMAYAVHSKHDRAAAPPAPEAQLQTPQQDWAGHLAELAPTAAAAAPSEPMSSAAMVVPKAQLALPALPVRLPVRRPCLDSTCLKAPPAALAASTLPKRATVTADRARERSKGSLLGMLNPLNHLPDVAVVGRPFTYAGSAVAGWFKRL